MHNKWQLMHIIHRAESGKLLPGEAQILREAVESLDDLQRTVDCMCQDTGTGMMRAILQDDNAPGRP
jgi:hypothetical protein